jgi:mRNA interferase MazF
MEEGKMGDNKYRIMIEDHVQLKSSARKISDALYNVLIAMDFKRATKVINWLDTWINKYLQWETNYDSERIKADFRRGHFVYANFGFNIGKEFGGIHYGLILDNFNGKKNGTIMIVPVKSLDSGEVIDSKYEIIIGYGLFDKEEITDLNSKIELIKSEILNNDKLSDTDIKFRESQLKEYQDKFDELNVASVAKVSQIRALSKIRVLYPKKDTDKIYSVKVDTPILNKIDEMIMNLFLKNYLIKYKE